MLTRLFNSELPAKRLLFAILIFLPFLETGGKLRSLLLCSEASSNAFFLDHIDANFGHVEPACMNGSVLKDYTFRNLSCLLRWKGLVKRFQTMYIQVIANQNDFYCFWIQVKNKGSDFICPVDSSTTVCRSDIISPRLRLDEDKDIFCPHALVFVIQFFRVFRSGIKPLPHISDKLQRNLVHTHHGVITVIGQGVQIQHPFHP